MTELAISTLWTQVARTRAASRNGLPWGRQAWVPLDARPVLEAKFGPTTIAAGNSMGGAEKVAQFLSSNIPKDFLLSVDAHFRSAVERGTAAGEFADPGHRSTVIGCNRHYALNEALDLTFNEFNVPHLPLRGNVIVAGQLGRVTVARFHKNKGLWDNSRRSAGKLKLCKKNTGVETLVQPDFLEVDRPSPSEMTCFLVTEHNGEPREMCEVHLVVPDSRMDLKNLLFSEPLGLFLQRYEKIAEVRDIAVPRLKPGVLRKPGDSAGHE